MPKIFTDDEAEQCNSDLVRFVAQFCIAEGRNVLFCMRRYQCTSSDTMSNISVDEIVRKHVKGCTNEVQIRDSKFLFELVSIRDHVLRLPSDFCPFDIVALIEYVCTP